jgi:uncharacterized protein YPO0396
VGEIQGVSAVTDDTRDRVIALEVKVQHLEDKLDKAATKITEMHDVFMQARGARYVIIAAAAIGGAIAGFMVKFIPWTVGLPK